MDASNFSPQGAAGAIVVGAVDSNNVMMPNCNYGPLVTVFALGVNILSAWIGRPSATIRSSGTFAVRDVLGFQDPAICLVFPL